MTRFLRLFVAVSALSTVGAAPLGVMADDANLGALLVQAQGVLRKANTQAASVAQLLDEARRARDAKQSACLDRKLTEIHASARALTRRLKGLETVVSMADAGRAAHESQVLEVSDARLEQIGKEAAQCAGLESLIGAGSQVLTMVPLDSPSFDPRVLPPDLGVPLSVSVPALGPRN